MFFYFLCVMKKVDQGNIPFVKTIHIMYVFTKGIIRKMNCYWHMRFFFDLYQVNKQKDKIILSTHYKAKSKEKKLFQNMDSSNKTTVKKNRFKVGLHRRIFLKINTTFNTHMLYQHYSYVYTDKEFSKTNALDLSFLFVFLLGWIN